VKNVVTTDRGPKPIGPYSQAIKANGFIYLSGQVALDPKSGELVGAEIRQQTERVLENIKGILEAAGGNLHHVIKTHRVPEGHERFPGHERSLRTLLHLRSAGPLDSPGFAPS